MLKKTFKFIFAFAFALIFVGAGLCGSNVNTLTQQASPAAAEPEPSPENLVVAKNRDPALPDLPNNNNTGTFGDREYSSYLWRDLSRFVISANTGSLSDPDVDGHWTYSVELGFYQTRSDSNQEFTPSSTIVKEDTVVDSLDDITFEYYIDEDGENDHYSQDLGWGFYRFILTINNTQHYTKLLYVEPDSIEDDPEIQVTREHSDTGLEGDWTFTITNYSDYIDQSLLRWYVIGERSDGNYALFNTDINNGVLDDSRADYFPGSLFKHYIFRANAERAPNRNRKTFTLNTLNYTGEWEVYCVVYDATPLADNSNLNELRIMRNSRDKDIYRVRTGNTLSREWVIWVIIAAAVVLVIGLVVIIVVSVKREKVW